MQGIERGHEAAPLISVVMANFEAGEKIVHALHSVLRQSLSDIEIIVSDDCSGDDSLAHVRRLMEMDSRIRLITAVANGGPARCRNRALDAARGKWIAVVDSDDIIHPERFERLIAAAEAHDCDIVADDLLLFFEDGSVPKLMLGEGTDHAFLVSAERWILAGTDGSPALGYLKPLIRAERLKALRYDERLRIGEDFDLILRLLLDGGRMLVVPEPFYLYRRHSQSISHRLSVGDMEAMAERQRAVMRENGALDERITAAFAQRLDGLQRGLTFERLVASLKGRRFASALAQVARRPTLAPKLFASIAEGRQRRAAAPVVAEASPVLVLGAGSDHAVPDYVPAHLIDWSAPRPREIWRELASRRGHGAVRCIPLDAAGEYAAGFIPEAVVSHPERVELAS